MLLRLCRQPTRSKQDALVGGEWTSIRYEQWQNKLKRNRKSPLLLQNIRSSTVRKGNSPQSGFVNMAYHKTPFLLPPASVHSFPVLIRGYAHTIIMMDIILCVLGALAKLPKAIFSSVASVCPSVRMGQLGSHWTDFHEIDIRVFF